MYINNLKVKLLSVGVVAVLATGCTNSEMNKTQKGALIGGIAGAVLGKSTSNHDDKRAVIGGVVGAAVGAGIGSYMDKQEAELKQQMEGTGVEVQRQGDNIVLNMPDSITFDTARADIKPQFYDVLTNLANTLSTYEQTRIKIAGHTDSRGAAEYNQRLSEQRAQSVRTYLSSYGVAESRMTAIGYGEAMPIADNNTPEGQAKNRRVEITLIPVQ